MVVHSCAFSLLSIGTYIGQRTRGCDGEGIRGGGVAACYKQGVDKTKQSLTNAIGMWDVLIRFDGDRVR